MGALLGGILIGLAVMLLLLANGRVAGISGIVAGVVRRKEGWAWQGLFVAGLVAGGVLARVVDPTVIAASTAALPVLVVAGVLVGVGTRMARGCTSGHGVCGVSRASLRSIVATATFMAVAAGVVFLLHRTGGGVVP